MGNPEERRNRPGRPGRRRWCSPICGDQPPVPGEQRRRGHREDLAPSPPGDQPGQCREPQPAARLVADPADLRRSTAFSCRSTSAAPAAPDWRPRPRGPARTSRNPTRSTAAGAPSQPIPRRPRDPPSAALRARLRRPCVGGDERQHIARPDLIGRLAHHRKEHLQVIGRGQHRIRPAPAAQELQIHIRQRHPHPDSQPAPAIPRTNHRHTCSTHSKNSQRHPRPSPVKGGRNEKEDHLHNMHVRYALTARASLAAPRV